MNCRAFENDLKDFAAELLPPRREAKLRAHLDGCETCRKTLAAERALYDSLSAALRAEMNPPVPPNLTARIRAPEEVASGSTGRRHYLLFTPLAAAALVIVFVVAGRLRHHPDEPPDVLPPSPALVTEGLAPKVQPSQARSGSIRRVTARPRMALKAPGLPEILVPPDEERALMEFARLVQRRQNHVAAVGEPEDGRSEIALLEVAQLEVKPLDKTDGMDRRKD